ncbi:MAG: hypothetical protein JST81_02115 [Bacteroidetes bacterium]|nr:hypothetical protein [Bacteroidota bacterium]
MKHKIVCIGAMLVDELFYCMEQTVPATSNPATVKRSAGGVMRNIVQHLALLNIPASFITITADDADGQWLREDCRKAGIDLGTSFTTATATGKYVAILNPDGTLFTAACVNPAESCMTISLLQQRENLLSDATMIVADTNLSAEVLEWLNDFCRHNDKLLFIEPVSVLKAKKLQHIALDAVYMITPNEEELVSLFEDSLTEAEVIERLLLKGIKKIWLRRGGKGSEIISQNGVYSLPAVPVPVKDITGAGDAALAAWLAAYFEGYTDAYCLKAAHAMAAAVIQVEGAVDANMSKDQLYKSVKNYFPDEY